MRHWKGRSGFPVSLLPRASSWVIPGAGAGLGLTPGLPRGLRACVTSSLEGCGDYAGPPWPGKCRLDLAPLFLGPRENGVVLLVLTECADSPQSRRRAVGEFWDISEDPE